MVMYLAKKEREIKKEKEKGKQIMWVSAEDEA